jgi:BioD-like phosphotransacetylase family protein
VKSLIIASTSEGAGKTSVTIGLAKALAGRFGYVKPLGDRFLYRKKRLWDHDASLLAQLFQLDQEPETVSIGFDHSKLRYMYDRATMFETLSALMKRVGSGRDAVFVECGPTLSHGASVCLDPLTISQETGAPVLIVAGGSDDRIGDDLAFVHRFVGADEATVAGVIVNKVEHLEDFRAALLPEIEGLGLPVFGTIPYDPELTTLSVATVADKLFARVLTGEEHMQRTIQHVVVGAMSVSAAMKDPLITAPNKLIITSGDRSDMILAALDAEGTSALVLTNSIVPPANVLSRAAEKEIPVLLVPENTYTVALRVEKIEPLIAPQDTVKIERITALVASHVDVDAVRSLVS